MVPRPGVTYDVMGLVMVVGLLGGVARERGGRVEALLSTSDLLSAGRRSRSHALLLLPQAVALLLLLKMKFIEDGTNRKVERGSDCLGIVGSIQARLNSLGMSKLRHVRGWASTVLHSARGMSLG